MTKGIKRDELYKEIVNLEKKYFDTIWEIFTSAEFIKDLEEVSAYIKENYKYLSNIWGVKNKIKIAAERLIRFHSYKKLGVEGIYPSPLSSDMAIITKDCVINIDAKTIDMYGNPGDDTSVHFQKNQITFTNKPFFSAYDENKSLNYYGIPFPPFLPPFYFHNKSEKPVLTFFLTINYYDDGTSFNLEHLSLCIVPHGVVVDVDYENEIISNYKTYDYLNKEEALKLKDNRYMPTKVLNPKWVALDEARNTEIYVDQGLEHPINEGQCGWKKIDNQYKIVVYGGSARIIKEKLIQRTSSTGKWDGFKKMALKKDQIKIKLDLS